MPNRRLAATPADGVWAWAVRARSVAACRLTDGTAGRGRFVVPRCIRRALGARRRSVRFLPPPQQEWVIRPLLDAGLGLDRISDLLFRLGFEAIVSQGQGTAAEAWTLVSSEPPHVQAAWHEVVGRLLSLRGSNA